MDDRGQAVDVYTHGHHEAVLRAHRWRTAENSAAYLLPHLRPGMRLLDVGCGPGTLTVDLARRVAPGGRVLGVDVAADVVAEAEAHAAQAGVDDVAFQAGDFRELGLDAGSFDVVHAHQVLQHLRDPIGALRAMAELARPDSGLVAVRDSDYAAMTWAPANDGLDRWMAVYQQVTRRNGAEPNAGRHLLAWAHQAGLTDVTYSTSTWTYATPEDRTWWATLWAERTVSSSLADQAVTYGLATPTDLADIATGWRRWAESDDAVFVVLHAELLASV
jgi:2-polyprenyl-3-methyl-5-hydroxy-6-metoxy-1,4-benzoquinol methylase